MSLSHRKQLKAIVFQAVEKAADITITNCAFPGGKYVDVYCKDIRRTVTRYRKIRIYGTVTYAIRHVGPERSVDEYMDCITKCLEEAQNNVFTAMQSALDYIGKAYPSVRQKWRISVGFKADLHET